LVSVGYEVLVCHFATFLPKRWSMPVNHAMLVALSAAA